MNAADRAGLTAAIMVLMSSSNPLPGMNVSGFFWDGRSRSRRQPARRHRGPCDRRGVAGGWAVASPRADGDQQDAGLPDVGAQQLQRHSGAMNPAITDLPRLICVTVAVPPRKCD